MITAKKVLEYQKRVDDLKRTKNFTGNNFKALGREIVEKYGVTERQALDILNNHQDEILKLLANNE